MVIEKKRGAKKYIYLGFLIVLINLVLIQLVFAGFFSDLRKTITGEVSSLTTTVSITVTGTNISQITNVSLIANMAPVEINSRQITFSVQMTDPDGVNDLNDSSVSANFTRPGEALRQNSSCKWLNDINGYSANYSCTIDLWYWDGNGDWNVSVRGTDLGNKTYVQNLTTNFTYTQLKAMAMSPTALTWPNIVPGLMNQTSSNDPTVINNTGNYNGTITLLAIDLIGESVPADKIYAANFSVGLSTGGSPIAECTPATATSLVNNSATTITSSTANRGNLSLSNNGIENFYYCIKATNPLSSQVYSTTTGGSWTISY